MWDVQLLKIKDTQLTSGNCPVSFIWVLSRPEWALKARLRNSL